MTLDIDAEHRNITAQFILRPLQDVGIFRCIPDRLGNTVDEIVEQTDERGSVSYRLSARVAIELTCTCASDGKVLNISRRPHAGVYQWLRDLVQSGAASVYSVVGEVEQALDADDLESMISQLGGDAIKSPTWNILLQLAGVAQDIEQGGRGE